MTPKKMSPEEMAFLLSSLAPSAVGWRVIEPLRAHIAAEAERDVALADNAALREQAVHGHECRPPYPAGCRCVLSQPHPGAALLGKLAADIAELKRPVPCCERDHDGDGSCDRHLRSGP